MVGIVSYGAYIPLWRIKRELMGREVPGERTVAGKDEDSLTMAVSAALNCVENVDREKIDGVFFASTTSPFREKCAASMIAAVLDLKRNVFTVDFADSTRAGTSALRAAVAMVKSGSARQILVTAADCRLGPPGSVLEQSFGDGAAAILVGGEGTIADFEGEYSVYDEIYDAWRRDVDLYVNTWEDRFIYLHGYHAVLNETVSGLMREAGVGPKDVNKVVLPAPEVRRVEDLARSLGFDPKTQLQSPLLDVVGNTGTAQPLMLLAAALEEANPGDRLIVAGYGNGGDALMFKVREGVKRAGGGRRSIKAYLQRKKYLPSYATYLMWRKLVYMPQPRVPMTVSYPSATAMWRERKRIYSLYGVKCRVCGTIQYPPQRVCINCQAKDNFDEVRLGGGRGRLFTYSFDFIRGNVPIGLVNLEGGGRIFVELTDVEPEELKIDLPVELTFRRLDLWREDGMYGYFWKATPIRE